VVLRDNPLVNRMICRTSGHEVIEGTDNESGLSSQDAANPHRRALLLISVHDFVRGSRCVAVDQALANQP
jgi:hypothetical protein